MRKIYAKKKTNILFAQKIETNENKRKKKKKRQMKTLIFSLTTQCNW